MSLQILYVFMLLVIGADGSVTMTPRVAQDAASCQAMIEAERAKGATNVIATCVAAGQSLKLTPAPNS